MEKTTKKPLFFITNYISSLVPHSLRPPKHGDEFKDQYVQTIWYAFTVGAIICLCLSVLFAVTQFWINATTCITMAIVALCSLYAIKKGRLYLSIAIVISSAYCITLLGPLLERGIDDIGVQAIYPILFIISAFMHRRAVIFFTSITIVWIVVLIYLESIGFYINKSELYYNPLTKGIITGSLFLLAVITMRYTIQKTLLVTNNLNKAKKEAEQANRLKSMFLTNMSHELRTPLNAIIGYSEGILEENLDTKALDEDTLEDITRIQKSGRHLLTLINDILDLSKIEADKMELQVDRVDLHVLITEIINTVRPMAGKNKTTLNFPDSHNELVLITDRQKLKQALLNLVSNAVKYTQKGEVSILISTDIPEIVKIAVADTGVGISAEEIPYIFDSFRQVDSSLSRSFSGTGLGLAITKRMTDVIGGDLQVESEEGQGSIFTLTIPLEISAVPNKSSTPVSVPESFDPFA
ncbi:MAG: sensor histidine kinase [Anaerolineae bacterium]